MNTLEEVARQVEIIDRQYQELVNTKHHLEWELSNPALTEHMTRAEAQAWRIAKKNEKNQCEAELGKIKLERKKYRVEFGRLEALAYKEKMQAISTAEIDRLKIENERLRGQCLDWESKYRTLERQYDAVIRQLNAVPKSMRAWEGV